MMYLFNEQQKIDIDRYVFMAESACHSEEKVDVIFVPGCARPELAEEAAKLYQSGYAPLIIPSGAYTKVEGGFRGIKAKSNPYGENFDCEADYLEAVLLANGVSKEGILKEKEATYTLENAEKTRLLLEQNNLTADIKSAILCCKAHHARRAYFYYSLVFPDLTIYLHPVNVDGISRQNWHTSELGRKAVFGEMRRMGEQLLMMENRITWE